MKVHEFIAGALRAEACRDRFGLLGDGALPLWAGIAQRGDLRLLPAWHEAAAVAMAEGQ
ncbi:hypothetical protein GVY41_18235 [Frigidibacter albus]|uniref:Thiamine pyrophosphate enzyme N-terminal TPP-binding domain-containing protein n=1 Tax=Frigidibacter albus TaxID=1465486 RepID=A0A6L8VKZ3_9RHOB|nr:thiamine pyrophosphate-binding protein [Frigidibacter albus]MZQ91057.1 hypothetical protein [Frigidibacter albus]NBE32942.1 hypothetical protein [Frigidibacter albus]GGH62554.1 hypothetical protein GCM10011341_36850 [Frigidibacter albus]